jgi:hypothetical protein
MSGVNVALNRFEELKRCVVAGKRIDRCPSEDRGDEGFSVIGVKEENKPDLIGKTISHYRIVAPIGNGGMRGRSKCVTGRLTD